MPSKLTVDCVAAQAMLFRLLLISCLTLLTWPKQMVCQLLACLQLNS